MPCKAARRNLWYNVGMNIRGMLVAALIAAVSAHCGAAADGVELLPSAFDGKTPVVVETKAFKFVINPDATARSLVLKATGEECLAPEAGQRYTSTKEKTE